MLSQWLETDIFLLLVFSLAVRFGRIPKREKQRLLEEMQSYMNSLNESGSMEVDSSHSLISTEDCNTKEAIGTISRAYRDIFTSNISNQERSTSRANITSNNNNTSSFSQDSSFPQVSSHSTLAQSYQSCPVVPATVCPVASNHNQPAFQNVDNNHYSHLVSTNQNHNQLNVTTPQRSSSANHNSFVQGGSAQNQPTCPWKLTPGAKVLVSTRSLKDSIKMLGWFVLFVCFLSSNLQFCSVLFFIFLRPVLLMHALYQGHNAPVRRYGSPSLSVSLLLSRRWWSLQKASLDFKSLASKTRSCC